MQSSVSVSSNGGTCLLIPLRVVELREELFSRCPRARAVGIVRYPVNLVEVGSDALTFEAVNGMPDLKPAASSTGALASVGDAHISAVPRLRPTLRIERLPDGRVEEVGCDEVT